MTSCCDKITYMKKYFIAVLILLFLASCSPSEMDRELVTTITEEEGESIASEAMHYLGIPYKWGGQSYWWEENPSVDCSGFVINVYKTALEPYGKKLQFNFLQKKDETVFFIDASSREDTMKVLVRSYPETEPMILSYGRMLCRVI